MTVNELTDVLLYQAVALAAAAAAGISRAFQASESELQYNASDNGAVIQHGHFAASAVTHRALDRLLQRFDLRLGSLTYPLHGDQVEALLHRRYQEIADLQFSCWSAEGGEQACGECIQCIDITAMLLVLGISPRRAGIDPGRAFPAWVELRAKHATSGGPPPPTLHPGHTPRHKSVRAVQSTTVTQLGEILDGDPSREAALDGFRRMREQVSGETAPPHPGYLGAFLGQIDPDLREPLQAIFDEYFEPTGDPEFARMAARSDSLARWIAAPLSR